MLFEPGPIPIHSLINLPYLSSFSNSTPSLVSLTVRPNTTTFLSSSVSRPESAGTLASYNSLMLFFTLPTPRFGPAATK